MVSLLPSSTSNAASVSVRLTSGTVQLVGRGSGLPPCRPRSPAADQLPKGQVRNPDRWPVCGRGRGCRVSDAAGRHAGTVRFGRSRRSDVVSSVPPAGCRTGLESHPRTRGHRALEAGRQHLRMQAISMKKVLRMSLGAQHAMAGFNGDVLCMADAQDFASRAGESASFRVDCRSLPSSNSR